MSAAILRDNVRGELNRLIDEYKEILVVHTEFDIGDMRRNQGFILGLKKAEEILSDAYRAMNG